MAGTLLVLLGRAETAAACLAAAGEIAAAYDPATLTILHVRIDPERTVLPEEVLTEQRRREIEGEEAARAAALEVTMPISWFSARRQACAI